MTTAELRDSVIPASIPIRLYYYYYSLSPVSLLNKNYGFIISITPLNDNIITSICYIVNFYFRNILPIITTHIGDIRTSNDAMDNGNLLYAFTQHNVHNIPPNTRSTIFVNI